MDKMILRQYLPAMLMFVGFGLVWSARSQDAIPLVEPIQTVLPTYEGMRITQQTIGDDERRIAGMTDYVARVYWNPDSTVAFTAYTAYYDRQSQGHAMHSPKNCLPGAGWEILNAGTGTIAVGGQQYVVNKNLLKNGHSQALVLYWYQGRGRVVASEYVVKWNLLRDAALKGRTDEALVRIIIPVKGAAKLGPAQLQSALADAEKLGNEVGARLLVDVARVIPKGDGGVGLPQRAAVVATPGERSL